MPLKSPRRSAVLALFASILWTLPVSVLGQNCEGGESPGLQVPAAYWMADFEPALNGGQLPSRRDSTTWNSLGIPGYEWGLELFTGVATVPGILFAGYNAGFHVWDISAGQEEIPSADPLAYRDGWMGDFESFPHFGEVDIYGNAVAAYQDGSTAYFAYAARSAAGLSLWKLDMTAPITTNSLTQIYQDTNVSAYSVDFEKIGTTLYAIVAVSGASVGIVAYDVDRADALGGCFDIGSYSCSNVFSGLIGTSTVAKYVDALKVASGNVLVSSSSGSSGGVELWEVGSSPELAIKRLDDLEARSHGTALFEKDGTTYLAVVEQVLLQGGNVNIYDIDACIGSNCNLTTPEWSSRPIAWRGGVQKLTYSESGGIPFLHYGMDSSTMLGAANDFLADLSTLGTTNQVSYIGDSGATFLDSCSNEQVGYWGWYYPGNEDGRTEYSPIQGRFEGNYFYRAGWTMLDVHIRGGGGGEPTITATASTPVPHWMDEPLDFSATRTSCPGDGAWGWSSGDSLPATIINNGELAEITYALCAESTDCPERSATVTASHSACPAATEVGVGITLVEPRAQIRSLDIAPPADPQSYPVCSQLSFSANVDGRDDPMTYLWEVRDSVTDELVHTGTGTTLDWDTSAVIVTLGPDIFMDGFESGDATMWDFAGTEPESNPSTENLQGNSNVASQTLLALIEGTLATRDFDIDLTVTNRGGAWMTQSSELFTLTEIGDLALENPAITAIDFGSGQFEFTAQGSNATLWRWEIEDPENGTEACTLFGGMCQVLDYGTEDSVLLFQWAPPNVAGTYQIGVSIANCTTEAPVSGVISVFVDEIVLPEPLEMTTFTFHPDSVDNTDPSAPCHWILFDQQMECLRSATIEFTATATGSPSHIELDWEGDGSFEQPFAVDDPIVHIYSSIGIRNPEARAKLGGSTSDPIGLTFLGTPTSVKIVTSH